MAIRLWNKGFACIEFLKFYLNDCIYVCFGVCEERGLYFPPVSNIQICNLTVSRATAINVVRGQVIKGFELEYQAKELVNCILKTLV